MKRYLMSLVLGATLLTPVALLADDHDHDKRRYYDPDARDYHEWNQREDRAYRHYLEEQHHQYRDWNKANKKEQREYWRWRHRHMDYDGSADRDRDRR